jgi:hypothetical protein
MSGGIGSPELQPKSGGTTDADPRSECTFVFADASTPPHSSESELEHTASFDNNDNKDDMVRLCG